MTTYLITEAQRQQCIDSHLNNAVAILQSLPMVENQPVGIVVYKPKMLRVGVLNREGLALPDGTRLYASPQTLTPITADDVTDEMREQFLKTPYDAARKDVFVAAVNAYLVITHRSEV